MEETIMRGRYPLGPEYVEQLAGSPEAKRRAKIILETLTGQRRVQDACQALQISEQRFAQLRQEMLQAAVERLETRAAGRPRRQAAAPDVSALGEQLAETEEALRAAQVREEIALTLPEVVHEAAKPGKKSAAPPKRQARPGWWKNK
jgi:hypothetical protein